MRSIQKEIGDGDDSSDLGELRRRVEEAGMPEGARRETERELGRLAAIQPAPPESTAWCAPTEWMADLPWSKLSGGEIDVGRARKVLDDDHYDPEKVKERILEHLAVQKLRQRRVAERSATEPLLPQHRLRAKRPHRIATRRRTRQSCASLGLLAWARLA